MPSQGDELMLRKMANLERHARQQHNSQEPSRAFLFTEQMTPPRANDKRNSAAIPDNWMPATQSGQYFAAKSQSRATSCNVVGSNGLQDSHRNNSEHHNDTSSRPHRLSPVERQERLDRIVQDRLMHALEEQRRSEESRLDGCRAQREIELMKFHQRMKQRTELQCRSNQSLVGHNISQMGVEALMLQTSNSAATRTAMERDEHRGDAQRQHIEYNRDRIEHNLLHRQYCLDSLKERERFRQGLEAHIGTAFSKSKTQLLNEIGVVGPESTFVGTKTLVDITEEKAEYIAKKKAKHVEDVEIQALCDELTALDETLWEERRANKGKKSVRSREVAYAVFDRLPRSRSTELY